MAVALRRNTLQEVEVELRAGVDAQGKPTYDSPAVVNARVVREDAIVRQPNGGDVQTNVTMWIEGDEVPLPEAQSRVTTATGWIGIVVERLDRNKLQTGVLDHIRIRLREE